MSADSDFEADKPDFWDPLPGYTAKQKKPKKSDEEKMKAKEVRMKIKEERMKLKEEKDRQKMEKKKTAELLRQSKPGECMKFIIVNLDSKLLTCKFGGDLLTALQAAEININIKDQRIPNSITWTRKKELEDNNEDEKSIVIVWSWEDLIHLIACDRLKDQIKEFKNNHSLKITLVIIGLESYFRFQQTKKNRNLKNIVNDIPTSVPLKRGTAFENAPVLSRMDVETALGRVQLLYGVKYRSVQDGQELGTLINQINKSVAELPFKLAKYQKEGNNDWFATADSKECVRVDNYGNGLLRLWEQQICQFNNVGLDVAQAIVTKYNSPASLIEAYGNCQTKKEAELLLQNIEVRRGAGPLTSVRRVGPELSKKVYLFFNSVDGDATLSNET